MMRVPLPASKSALKRLGRRLSDGSATASDQTLFEDTLLAFDEVRQRVFEQISSHAGLDLSKAVLTSRTKTRDTLLDKLIRTPAVGLAAIHDIAGLRIVVTGGLDAQDQVAQQLMQLALDEDSCFDWVEVVDRRATPAAGYRAVHVIVRVDEAMFVEIQIRTALQDDWAQMYERMGDRWGRAIRYSSWPVVEYQDFAGLPSDQLRVGHIIAMAQFASLNGIAPIEEHDRTSAKAKYQLRDPRGRAEFAAGLEPGHRVTSELLREAIARGIAADRAIDHLRRTTTTLLETLAALIDSIGRLDPTGELGRVDS